MALPPSSAANQTAALRLGLLSCLPITRRTATNNSDEQMFGAE